MANRSPPMPVIDGSTTASTAAAVTAASIALPPSCSTFSPALEASAWLVAIMPFRPSATERVAYGLAAGRSPGFGKLSGLCADAVMMISAASDALTNGFMAVDVAHILTKGRHPFRAIRTHIVADREQDAPHRFVKVTLRFTVEGDLSSESVGRAIALSHDKYCSVWHSMRQDIAFTTAFEVQP